MGPENGLFLGRLLTGSFPPDVAKSGLAEVAKPCMTGPIVHKVKHAGNEIALAQILVGGALYHVGMRGII